MTTAPHILIARYSPDGDGLDYEVECPGLENNCRAYKECRECTKRAADDDEFDDEMHAGEPAHGVEHEWLMAAWCVPTNSCLVKTHEYIDEAVRELPITAPGRYPVDHKWENDGEFIELTLVRQ